MFSQPRLDCTTTALPALDAYHAALAHTRPVGNATPDTDPAGFAFRNGGRRRATVSFACGLP